MNTEIIRLLLETGFSSGVFTSTNDVWYIKDFVFNEINFRIVVFPDTLWFYVLDKTKSQVELFNKPLTYETLLETLTKWGCI